MIDVITVPSRRTPLSSINPNARNVQLTLDRFFYRPKAKAKTSDEAACPSPDSTSPITVASRDNIVGDDLDEPRPAKKAKKDSKPRPSRSTAQQKLPGNNGRGSRQAADQSDLPPISSIPMMFDDLVARAGKLGNLVDRLNGRKLRVATMCSGTESPLLALRMITRSLFKETGKRLDIEHIFSCEIEPFKQAYIERNFSPPILFRDVLELADDYAYPPDFRELI